MWLKETSGSNSIQRQLSEGPVRVYCRIHHWSLLLLAESLSAPRRVLIEHLLSDQPCAKCCVGSSGGGEKRLMYRRLRHVDAGGLQLCKPHPDRGFLQLGLTGPPARRG